LKVIRILVTTLLLGAIILGFTREVWVEEASGVITSYSTWITTEYSTRYTTSYSTQYRSTTVTTEEILSQNQLTGPYLRIMIAMLVVQRKDTPTGIGGAPVLVYDIGISNLMDTAILNGSISIRMAGAPPQKIGFESIGAGERIRVYGEIGTPVASYPYFEEVSFTRQSTLVNQVPVATESRPQVVTVTYARTLTTMYTISEPLLDNAVTISALVLVATIVIAALVLMKRKRRS
jgi:hypothetical protein